MIFLIPFAIFTVFTVVSCTRWFEKIDKKMVRRVYYLLCLLWSYNFITRYYNEILCINIDTKLDISKNIINTVSCIFLLLVFFGLWDFLFISTKNISSFSFKDLSITTEEFNELAKASEIKYEDFEILGRIIEVQYTIMWEMYYFVSKLEDTDARILYRNILDKYVKYRKEISINSFTNDTEGLKQMKKYFNLNDIEFSSIQHCININKVCVHNGNKDRIFAVIKTKFIENDMIVVITGHRVMRNEHYILQNIISYFDAINELDIKEMNIEELKNQLNSDTIV